jgi:hypothetical protein
MRFIKFVLMGAVMVSVLASVTLPAAATENGGGAYPNGAEGFMSGALPPPGQYFVNYLLYYHASDLMDGRGHTMDVPFDLDAAAEVARFINVTKYQFLGASWAQHIFVPVTYLDVNTPGGSDEAFGLGDIIVDPFILAWHKPPFHWVVGLDTYVPIGKYDENDIANISRNYWTFEPVAALTYLSTAGLELSAKVMYDINLENPDTDYESGDEFHTDFVAAYHMNNLALGVGGYYYRQTTDDKGDIMPPGGPVDAGALDGYKGEQWALGPQVSYQHKDMSFILALDHEFETQNRPEGDRAWFKFVKAL